MEQPAVASKFAYAAVICFVIGMVLVMTQSPPATFSGHPPMLLVVVSLAMTSYHLSLLPVIAALDAPAWAKGSGYAWVAVDNTLVFMSYFGVGADLITPMRLGIHLAAVSWIIGASAMAGGALLWVGGLAALAFLGSSFAGPFVGAAMAGQTLGPAAVLLVTWLVLVGRRLSTRK